MSSLTHLIYSLRWLYSLIFFPHSMDSISSLTLLIPLLSFLILSLHSIIPSLPSLTSPLCSLTPLLHTILTPSCTYIFLSITHQFAAFTSSPFMTFSIYSLPPFTYSLSHAFLTPQLPSLSPYTTFLLINLSPLLPSLAHWFLLFPHVLTHSLTHSLPYFRHPLPHSLCSLAHSLTHSLTHSLPYPTHSLIYPFTHPSLTLFRREIWADHHTTHPVHCTEKKLENFQDFFLLRILMYLSNFDIKICFLILFKTYKEYIFCFFTLETL
jgi:hypothetical protein